MSRIENLFRGIANIVMVVLGIFALLYGIADYGRNPQQIMDDYISEEYGEEYTGVILDAPGLYGDDYRVEFEVYSDRYGYQATVRL